MGGRPISRLRPWLFVLAPLAAAVSAARCGGLGNTQSTRLDHTRFFPIANGAHSSLDCGSCHDTTASSFTVFTCVGCHDHDSSVTNPAHAKINGYEYLSETCYICHPTGAASPSDHPEYFPIDSASAHAGVPCGQCHTDLSNPLVATNFACASCHLGLDSALVTKHTTTTSNPRIVVSSTEINVAESSNCLRCHGDSQVNKTSDHVTGQEGDPPHGRSSCEATCLICHDTFRSDKTFAADFTTDPRNNPGHGCANCHRQGGCAGAGG